MAYRTVVPLSPRQLEELSLNLQAAFNNCYGKEMKLTGDKNSKNYKELIKTIEEKTEIRLSASTLRDIVTLKHNGRFNPTTLAAIDKFISAYTRLPRSFGRSANIEPVKQKVYWGVNQGYVPGVFINGFNGPFIKWPELKVELETKVLPQCARVFPGGSRVELRDHYDNKDYLMRVFDPAGAEIGSVWLGGNPHKGWYVDGLVRLGKSLSDKWEVYMILQRYSDGSYRIVKSLV